MKILSNVLKTDRDVEIMMTKACTVDSQRQWCFVMWLDASHHTARRENVFQQRPLQQRADIASATQFCVGVDDADAGEFAAKFPTDDGHYITDYSDSATCYGDHYDDNYQVMLLMCCVLIIYANFCIL